VWVRYQAHHGSQLGGKERSVSVMPDGGASSNGGGQQVTVGPGVMDIYYNSGERNSDAGAKAGCKEGVLARDGQDVVHRVCF
jgi:hypothetical protein